MLRREREEYLWRNGCSQLDVKNLKQQEVDIIKILTERDKELQDQVQYNKIKKSKCNRKYRYINTGWKREKENVFLNNLEINKPWHLNKHLLKDCYRTGILRKKDIVQGMINETLIIWLRVLEKRKGEHRTWQSKMYMWYCI